MTIKYKVGRSKLGGEDRTFPRLVQGETVSADEFQRQVAQRAARGLADVAAVFIAAREVLIEELRSEQSVQMPGLGHLTLSLKGNLDDNERLVTQSVTISINFRPERGLLEAVNASQNFEYAGD